MVYNVSLKMEFMNEVCLRCLCFYLQLQDNACYITDNYNSLFAFKMRHTGSSYLVRCQCTHFVKMSPLSRP